MKNLLYTFLLLVVLGSTGQAWAQATDTPLTTHGGEKQLAALIVKSPLIIEGRAGESYSFWNAAHTLIFTATPITVYKVFKGEASSAILEVITWGGQVGNHASSLAHQMEPGLARQPTGVFFLMPTPHPDPKRPTAPAYAVVDGVQGFLQYDSYLKGGANTQSWWQLYPHVEASLYPAIATQVGHPYRELRPFDPRKFNASREEYRLDSIMYSRQGYYKSSTLGKALPNTKKKQFAKSNASSAVPNSNAPLAMTIGSFSPTTVKAGTFDSLTIIGSGFGNPNPSNPAFKPRVIFANAYKSDTYIRTPVLNIIRFSNTKIVLYVPSNDGSVSGGKGQSAASGVIKVYNPNLTDSITSVAAATPAVTIPRSEFNLLFTSGTAPNQVQAYRQVRIASLNGTGGIRFKYDANVLNHRLGPNYAIPTTKVIEETMRKWRCETQLNIGDSTFRAVPFSFLTTDCNIGFSSATNPIPPNLANALMLTNNHYNFCTGSNGNYAWQDAADVLINKDKIFSYDLSGSPIPTDSTRYDFKTSMLHELGHVVGLAHVADPAVLMYRSLAASQQKYAFSAEPEILGADNILRRSILANRCFAPMVALDTTTCKGAQLALSSRLFFTSCEPPRTYTVTASGATAYRWAPASAFIAPNANPRAATVTFNSPAWPYVYGMKDGLGDYIRCVYKAMPCQPTAASSTPAATLRTQVYPNPSAATFTVVCMTATDQPTIVVLYNAQGTVLLTRSLAADVTGQPQVFELPILPTGTYFLRTSIGGKRSESIQLYAE